MITLFVLTVCLFVIALLFGKRFGVPVLGLVAGFVVSGYESAAVVAVGAPYLKQYVSYVPVALLVLPALVLLLFVKGRHRKLLPRIVNSAVFAASGLVLITSSPLTPASLTGGLPFIAANAGLLVSAVVGLAVVEVVFGKPSKKKLEEPKK